MKTIQKVNIIGMGALGLMYGNMILDNAKDVSLQYIMDRKRVEKYQGQVINSNGEDRTYPIVCDEEAQVADLLLVAVKSTGLDAAIKSMKHSIGPDTVIISVMNGIDSEQKIGEAYGFSNIVYSVAQGMDAMKFGNTFSAEHTGELRIGITKQSDPEALARLKEFFDRAKIAYTEESDILQRLWSKFMLNVGINQVCMAYGVTYGQALADGEPNRVMIAAMREVIALANAVGIGLSENDLNNYIRILHTLNPDGMPSMAQDRVNKRYSEVQSFAGTVVRLAKEHGIYVPSNRYLYNKVKDIEAEYLFDKYEIRDVLPEDARAAADIEAICFPPSEACPYPIMKERAEMVGDCFIVCNERATGKMVGFINGLCTSETTLRDDFFLNTSLNDSQGKHVMVCSVAVLPEYRYQGIARLMMKEFLEGQKGHGRTKAILTCVPEKITMYEKFGYTDNGESISTWGGEKWHEMIYEF